MSDNRDQPQGGYDPADPWAPPNRDGVELSKPVTPPVHDQQTVTSMPAATGPGGEVPPPPVAPGGPAATPGYGYPTATPPAGTYGYPTAAPGAYGYPTAPTPPVTAGYGYPGHGQPGWQPPQNNNGMGTASMVLGILAVALSFCSYGILGLILGGVALPLGIAGRKRHLRGEANNRGQAVAGITLGSIGIALGLAGIALIIFIATNADEWSDSTDDPWSPSQTFGVAAR
ncbi:DUF4190 domain-containing protein [Streptomyces sp. NBC_00094]|uniref:DUF4190 domain-containing protein n=1 Tax=Streptomyces sp. NBC_00094 TaxID=2903620 RepID=UPI0022589F85|nr:DUF4190 domain-containing protein [Streptomyces sp. NBC_00094]MCX5393497.1 DUF4190 domain-containing protein [Streptomyces sp. NBC_00094]